MTVFVEKESWLYMPTAFSPNDDGENDVFFPQSGPEVLEIELFQIFDRWGDLVFQAREFLPNDPAFGWDGNFEGRPMNSQVLVWQTKVLLRDGSIHWLKGGVLLAR
ncbi:MAG: gliding motility-associated C-terminal domain-containing protein [Saprospirales bacterium]|nr:gliding motility-associated C-terminal domain-containing protein [Saprospirales bacterium]